MGSFELGMLTVEMMGFGVISLLMTFAYLEVKGMCQAECELIHEANSYE